MDPTHDTGLDEAFAEARPDDPAGLVLARARVASALFGATAGLGRFHVLERLGHGGMGVVYAAYDPELDRGVALKIVSVPEGNRELALAEAKALARLSHPNVVPVFDVGIVEDRVYIVMELVRGSTLRDWVKGKRLRDVLDVYRQAGLALAAAHAAGLVHRDFKPDNAIVGGDGRVRVVDFGLACEAAAAGRPNRAAAGTPRYMAPEQAAGVVTPAADQYSFCVSLAEALGRDAETAPLPRWIETIVQRGRAGDPAQRFSSMTELLRALARDPARLWRRRVIAGGLAAAVIAAFFVGRARTADAPEPCAGGDREIAASWDRTARDAQLARITGLSAYGRELAPRIAGQITDYAARWVANQRDACLAHRRDLQSDAMLDQRMACLRRGATALATVGAIASTADAAALPGVARALASLPDPDACADIAALATDIAPPPAAIAPRIAQLRRDLEAARVELAAGRSTATHAAAQAAIAELRALGYQPLLAEALVVDARAVMFVDPAAAITALREATAIAFASNDHVVAIEAWARREWLVGAGEHPESAFAGLDIVEALASGPRSAAFPRALLLNNVGSIELGRGRREPARAAFFRALEAAREVRGPGAVELTAIRRNIALVVDDLEQRERLYADTHAELARLLGPSHPDTLKSEYAHAANGVLNTRVVVDVLATTCERFTLHDSLAQLTPPCFGELGDMRSGLGDVSGAIMAYERAIARGGATHPEVPELAGYLLLWRGDVAGALHAFDAAIAALPRLAGQPFYKNYAHAKLRLGQARALRAAGKLVQARTALEHSLEILGEIDEHAAVSLQRRLNGARAELAAVLAATGGKPAAVHDLATRALAWYRRTGATPATLAELERLAGASAASGSP